MEVLYGDAGEDGFTAAWVSVDPDMSILMLNSDVDQVLSDIVEPNYIFHYWHLVHQQRLISFYCRCSGLEIPVDVAFWCFVVLFTLKKHEEFGLSFSVIYFDCEFCCYEAITDLGSLFPQLRVKSLSKCQHSLIINFLILINPNHMVSTCIQKYPSSKF